MAQISSETATSLQATIDSYTSRPNGVPGLVYSVINENGDKIFEHASGKRGLGSVEPMTVESVFWFASCTKLITAVAAMQLVEQGKLALDDGEQLERYLPELKEIKVLEEDENGRLRLVEKKRKITLRMLLSHTAGFSYSFGSEKIKKWSEPIGISEVTSEEPDIFSQPLVHQPGENWEYGVNMDWVGRLIERVSSLSLNDYFQRFILAPIGVSRISFFPSEEMKEKLAYLHQRNSAGELVLREDGHILRRPLQASTSEAVKATVNAGGHGCFGTLSDYCQIIATLLNHGTHPKTGAQILKPETMTEMLKNQIPEFPDFARDADPPAKPSMTNHQPLTYPQSFRSEPTDHPSDSNPPTHPDRPPQGWGLSFFRYLSPGPTGRAAGTIAWSGVANLQWWADMQTGIGGMIASQVLPFADAEFDACHDEVERALYAGIGKT